MGTAIVLPEKMPHQADLDRILEVAGPIMEDGLCLLLPAAGEEGVMLGLPREMEATALSGGGITTVEGQLHWLADRLAQQPADLVLFYGNMAGHELAAQLGGRIGWSCFPDVERMVREDGRLRMVRKTCGSYLDWALEAGPAPLVATVLRGRAAGATVGQLVTPVLSAGTTLPESSWLLCRELLEPRPENPLESASRLLIGGKGLGGKAACDRLRETAAHLDMVPGFTRPVAMNGWCGLHEIVGQSGCRASPEVCIALGVSGAAAFLAGVAGAKTLIAVNRDPDAPIFRHAQVGVVADAVAFLEALGN